MLAIIFNVPLKYVNVLEDILLGYRIDHTDYPHLSELNMQVGMSIGPYEALDRLLAGPFRNNLRLLTNCV